MPGRRGHASAAGGHPAEQRAEIFQRRRHDSAVPRPKGARSDGHRVQHRQGIAPENLEKIFDRFYREDLSHNSEVAGNGLGLAIARTIVQAHKGHIRAESEYGKSATFIVTLP
ncbi:MAG: hypothetical protein IJ769_08835 [Clostridia bacterium]|nr:hypothetical protein [Clostridia bacterium]